MGLGSQSNRVFLSVADGKIIQRATEGTPGAVPRTKTDGTIVWELRHTFIGGMLTSIATKTTEWNGNEIKSWILLINDAGQDYQLEVKYDSSYATSMFKALGNPKVDFNQPIKFAPYMKVVADKKKLSIYVSQDGENVEWYYTKETPNGMPEMEQVTVKGKVVWDNYKQMQFIEKSIVEAIKPKLKTITAAPASTTTGHDFNNPNLQAPDLNGEDDGSDLPF